MLTRILYLTTLLTLAVAIAGCRTGQQTNSKQLTLAVNSGVEGDALKQVSCIENFGHMNINETD